jgi:tetratricopeptide (TPR) repeat protein
LKTATNPNGNVYYLLASGYYNMEQMGPAVTNIKKAIDLTETPKEEWLVLYASLLNQTEKFQEGIPVAKRLISMNSKKKDYWMLLASYYGQMDDSKNALVVMQAAHHAGLLTQSSEIKNLASYMQIEGIPYNAAQLIEKSIEAKTLESNTENLESLANAWVGAAEYKKAVSVYERISNASSNGNTLHRIGELNMQVEDWPAASEAFEKALNKGGLKDTADTQYWLAIALYSQGKLRESKPWFERSATGKNGKNARAFVSLIDSKLQ